VVNAAQLLKNQAAVKQKGQREIWAALTVKEDGNAAAGRFKAS
jgi:hypothetical protein